MIYNMSNISFTHPQRICIQAWKSTNHFLNIPWSKIYRNKRTCLFIWAWVPIYSTRPCPLLQPFEHELIYSKFFDFLPNGMELHIQKTKDCPQSANLKSISEALLRGASSRETNKKPLVNWVESLNTQCRVQADSVPKHLLAMCAYGNFKLYI